MRVLILRPEPGASATAARVAGLGCKPVVVPLFDVVPLAWALPPGGFDAVAMTSANAARCGGDGLDGVRHLPLYAVGEVTVAAARAAGFDDVTAGPGDVGDLARLIPAGARILHLCGAERRSLAVATLTEVVVYRTVPCAVDMDAIRGAQVALLHAPSAAARLAQLVPPDDRCAQHLIAISARAAAAAGPGWRAIDVAERPREDAMLELLAALCEKQA